MNEHQATQTPRQILPDLLGRPILLLLAVLIPQLVLLIVNLNAYHLISGEVTEKQESVTTWLFVGQLFLILSGTSLGATFLARRESRVPWAWNWLILVPHVAFLVLFSRWVHDAIPSSLQVWIVPPEQLVTYQFVCLMPAIFISAVRIACFATHWKIGQDIGVSASVATGIPFLWYVLMHSRALGIFESWYLLIIIFFVLSTMVCVAGIIRIIIIAFNGLRGLGPGWQALFIFLIAVGGPIGGLLLNRSIPFPTDFQHPYIYVLAVVNGLALTIPRLRSRRAAHLVWFAQCLTFPFTLYFFAVFLPYLSLAILAILAAGAGFLVLAPTLLFVVHLKRLIEFCPTRPALITGILISLTVPAYLYIEARIDRAVLHQSIDYIYSPDYKTGDRFTGSRMAARRSLKRLHHIKNGIHLPFLTGIYQHVVLDNLVLSDAKLNHIHRSFFGEEPEAVSSGSSMFGMRNRGPRGRLAPPPPTNVELVDISHFKTRENGMVRTLVKLEMRNPGRRQSEFATTIDIPDGTFVSGYWLNVEGERVPGRIFEKKTAMWVYRMIRDATRRDPGLLTYASPTRLNLRVFPFSAEQTRTTEIEFLTPAGFEGPITIGDRRISSPSPNGPQLVDYQANSGQRYIVINSEATQLLPSVQRMPYIHVIVDRSANGLNREQIDQALAKLAGYFPEASQARLTLANYEIADLGESLSPLSDIRLPEAESDLLPLRGQFLAQRALERCLYRYAKEQSDQFPIMVVLSDRSDEESTIEAIPWFRSLLPDIEGFYRLSTSGDLAQQTFTGTESSQPFPHRPVHLFRSGSSMGTILAGADGSQSFVLEGKEPIEIFDPSEPGFIVLPEIAKTETGPVYGQGATAWITNLAATRNPAILDASLTDLVEMSRESGILIPSTAYIVVENTAQWKTLEQKEKKKLKGNQALDHMETPEPHWLLFLIFYFLFWLGKKQYRPGPIKTA